MESDKKMREKLIEDLEKIPRLMADKEELIYTLRQNQDELKLFLRTIELRIGQEVEAEEKDGKKVFSNATKRQIEAEARLSNDEEYQQKIDYFNNQKITVDKHIMELSFLRDRFSAVRAITRILGQ